MRYAILIVLLCIISSPMRGQEREHVSLDLRTRVYSKPINCEKKIIDTIFRIENEFSIHSVNVEREAYFSFAQFSNEAYFGSVKFSNGSYFTFAQFSNESYFSFAKFSKAAYFGGAKFSKAAYFGGAQFSNEAYFRGTQFSNESNFSDARFSKAAYFGGAQFSNESYFSDAQFSKKLSLNGIILSDSTKLYFNNCLLPDWIDFTENTGIKNEVDFTTANFDSASKYSLQQKRWHYINLYKTDLARVKIDYTHFRFAFYIDNSEDTSFKKIDSVHIQFRGTKYNINDSNLALKFLADTAYRAYILKVFPGAGYYACDGFMATLRNKIVNQYAKAYLLPKWFGTALPPLTDSVLIAYTKECIAEGSLPGLLPEDEVMTMYEQEIKILTDRGAMQSKQNLDIEYQDYRHGHNIIPHIWNCYGYHKEWVFYWTGIFIAFFSFITFWFLPFLRENVYTVSFFNVEDVVFKASSIRQFLKQLIARVWYSFVYTAVIFFLFSLKIENFKFHTSFRRILGTTYVIIVYTMGIICLAYMAGFVLQK